MDSVKDVLVWIEDRMKMEDDYFKEAKKLAGIDCPGANLALGAYSALCDLKHFIEEEVLVKEE